MQRISGLTTCLYGSSVVVFGGKQCDKLFHLDLLTLEWHCDDCHGVVPPSRLFHAAAVQGRHLFVCGGLSLTEAAEQDGLPRPSKTIPYKSMRPMVMYRLDLAELTWEALPCSGMVPMDRSHHTLSLVGSHSMVLTGGKPIGSCFTETQLKQFESIGFFDMYVLDLRAMAWRRLDLTFTKDEPFPRLWGHAVAAVDNGSALLIHGGFAIGFSSDEVDSDVPSPSEGSPSQSGSAEKLPTADLNSEFFVVNLETAMCTKFPAPFEALAPPPRALHNSLLRGRSELLCFGGLIVDDTSGGVTLRPSLEMWGWSPATGNWRPLPFCYDADEAGITKPPEPWPQFSRFPAVVYSETVVVVSTDLMFVELFDGARWNRMPVDSTCFDQTLPRSKEQGPAPFSPFDEENFNPIARKAQYVTSSDSHNADSWIDVSPAQVAALRAQVSELQAAASPLRDNYSLPSQTEAKATLEAIMLKTLLGRNQTALSPAMHPYIGPVANHSQLTNSGNAATEWRYGEETARFSQGLSRAFSEDRQRLRRRLTSPPDGQ